MRGLIIQTTGIWCTVLVDGKSLKCRLKGKLRLTDEKLTNPVAVGDWVVLLHDEESHELVITEIEKRKNHIIRQSPRKKHHQHIIGANIDQAIIIISIAKPRTALGFIDRFIIVAESYHIPVLLVINKVDLFNKKTRAKADELKSIYTPLGYPIIETSAIENLGIDELHTAMKGKINLISGYSGVGKSSLVNAINPNLDLKTAQISRKSEKGMHTTTFAEMHIIDDDTFIIDTPGIKELGLVGIPPEELSGYFVEMRALVGQCKFNNCQHKDEPGCAILKALEEGEICESRYLNYLNIVDSIEAINYWERA